jgi:large conductance mechanosensitive channel
MALIKEFKAFINKGNVVDLAVAVVIGAAFGKIVAAMVSDLVMPLVNAVIPHGDWRSWEVTPLHFRVGSFLGAVVDFLVVAFVVFLVMIKLLGALQRRRADATPTTKTCPECLEVVPAAARRCKACTSVLTVLALCLLAGGTAFAQAEPKFEYGKPDDVTAQAPAVIWKAQVKGGLLVTSGNSQTTNGSLGLNVSRREGGNRLTVDGNYAYGRSNVRTPVVDPANPSVIVGLDRRSVETTNNWMARGRYDRFVTANNAGFASGQAAADRVAGKSFFGGGQVGYMRQLLSSALQVLVLEIGYDYSNERYLPQPGKTLDPVSIHSARAFVGETLKLTPATGVTASVEALFNVNREAAALDVFTGLPGVAAFHDTRMVGKAGLTTTLLKSLSLALGFTLRYDQNPAPLPVPSGSPSGAAYMAGFQPFAEKIDTLTEANVIYTFL